MREEERTRIARELHDELGQALTALRFDLGWLRSKCHGEAALGMAAAERVGAALGVASDVRWHSRSIGDAIQVLLESPVETARVAAEWPDIEVSWSESSVAQAERVIASMAGKNIGLAPRPALPFKLATGAAGGTVAKASAAKILGANAQRLYGL